MFSPGKKQREIDVLTEENRLLSESKKACESEAKRQKEDMSETLEKMTREMAEMVHHNGELTKAMEQLYLDKATSNKLVYDLEMRLADGEMTVEDMKVALEAEERKTDALMKGLVGERVRTAEVVDQLRASYEVDKENSDAREGRVGGGGDCSGKKNAHNGEDPLLRSQVALTKALDQSCVLIRRAGQDRANIARKLTAADSDLRVKALKLESMQEDLDRRDHTTETLARVGLAQDMLVKARSSPRTDSVALMRVVDVAIDLMQGVMHPNKHADPEGVEVLRTQWEKGERDVQYLQCELNRLRRVLRDKDDGWTAKEREREERRHHRATMTRTAPASLGQRGITTTGGGSAGTKAAGGPKKKSPYATQVFAYDENGANKALDELIDLRSEHRKQDETETARRRSSQAKIWLKKEQDKKRKGSGRDFWVLPSIGGHSDHPLVDLDPEITVGRVNVGFLNQGGDSD
jgi:hypothetical protein